MRDIFQDWWAVFYEKSHEERVRHLETLTRRDRHKLKKAFFQFGWHRYFCQNKIDEILDTIKDKYSLDLIDIRIKSLKFNRTFIVDRKIWNEIQDMFFEYKDLYNMDNVFGGLIIKSYGTKKQFVTITG